MARFRLSRLTLLSRIILFVIAFGAVLLLELGIGHFPFTVFPLFFGGSHYGAFFVSLRREEMLFYYALSLEIGTGVRYLLLSLEQQEARSALKEKNQILDYSASHDSLTGLYNRPGLLSHVYAFIRQSGENAHFAAVMADLDHLKQINDTFGHNSSTVVSTSTAELSFMVVDFFRF